MRFHYSAIDCPRLDGQGVQPVRNLEAEEREQKRPEAMESEARPDVSVRQRAE